MTLRKLFPATALVLVLGTGCQRHAAAAAPPENASQAPAPFATPPTVTGLPDVATLAAMVRPSVVNITTVHQVHMQRQEMPDLGSLFPFFGGQGGHGPFGPHRGGGSGPGEGEDEVMRQQALGSGFIVDAQGHVLTNAHVVSEADEVKVKLMDDREYRAKVVGKDERLDLAVLQLENAPPDLPVASFGSSEALRVGEYVVAIGNPFGLGNTVTMGIVSAKGRSIGAGPYDDFIQTDASINPGNSGGPLFDLHGQVVGINTAINPQGRGIGFAIPVDAAKDVLPQLIHSGRVARGRMGALIQGMDAELAKALGLDRPRGALVEEVEPGSPAQKAGIVSGDVVTAVDGQEVPHSEELPRMIARHAPGTHVKLTVVHDRRPHDVDVTLAALTEDSDKGQPSEQGEQGGPNASSSPFGLALGEEGGRVIVQRVAPGGAADGKVHPGDAIEEVDRQPVHSASEAASKLRGAPKDRPVLLRVRRGEQSHYVAIEPGGGR
jgi:serine protease Do